MKIGKEKKMNIFKKKKVFLSLFFLVVFSFLYFSGGVINAAEDVNIADQPAVVGNAGGSNLDANVAATPGANSQSAVQLNPTAKDTNQDNEPSWFASKIILGLAWIVYAIVYTLGLVFTLVIGWLIQVAQWNNFIGLPVVITGWVILRDLVNMFFVLLLLMVAFATILRIDGYDIKKMVPKILIMAVLINFSRTICGLIIDASQIVMLTFVSGFSDGGAGQFVSLMGVDKMWAMAKEEHSNLNLGTIAGLLTALFASLIAFVVISAALVVLIIRVVYLWIYVILSPIAFFASAFPQGKSYSSRWWSDFMKQVTAGPILAFFIWLALKTAHDSTAGLGTLSNAANVGDIQGTVISSFFDNNVFATYLVTIGLLVAGLIETQKIGGAIGSVAGKGMGYINKGKDFTLNKTKAGMAGTAKYGYGVLKAGDAAVFKGGVSKLVNRVSGGEKTVGGALALGAIGGPIGLAIGAGAVAAGAIIKKAKKEMDNVGARQQAQMKISTNARGEKFYNDGEKDYKMGADERFHEWDKKNDVAHGTGIAQIADRDLRDAPTWKKRFLESLSMETGTGKGTRDIVQKEKTERMAKEYARLDVETIRRLAPVQGDKDKRNAMGLAAGKKLNASNEGDRALVNDVKDSFSSNSLLADAFMESMKSNATLYFSDKMGTILENSLSKAIGQGKIKLDDQSIKSLNHGALRAFAKASPDYTKFEKSLGNAVKNKDDAGSLKTLIGKNIGTMDYVDEDADIRKAYANVSGDHEMAHAHRERAGGGYDIDLRGETLLRSNLSSMKADDFANMDTASLNNDIIQTQMAQAINLETLKKVAKNNKMNEDNIRIIVRAMSSKNPSLATGIAGDDKLNKYL